MSNNNTIELDELHDYALLSTAQVAKLLHISEYRVRRLARDNALRAVAGFTQLHFTARSVRDFVAQSGATKMSA